MLLEKTKEGHPDLSGRQAAAKEPTHLSIYPRLSSFGSFISTSMAEVVAVGGAAAGTVVFAATLLLALLILLLLLLLTAAAAIAAGAAAPLLPVRTRKEDVSSS